MPCVEYTERVAGMSGRSSQGAHGITHIVCSCSAQIYYVTLHCKAQMFKLSWWSISRDEGGSTLCCTTQGRWGARGVRATLNHGSLLHVPLRALVSVLSTFVTPPCGPRANHRRQQYRPIIAFADAPYFSARHLRSRCSFVNPVFSTFRPRDTPRFGIHHVKMRTQCLPREKTSIVEIERPIISLGAHAGYGTIHLFAGGAVFTGTTTLGRNVYVFT